VRILLKILVTLFDNNISARFGPNGIRQGSRRIPLWALNVPWKLAVADHADILDCGDVRKLPITWCFKNGYLIRLTL
jgi:arginase family enzyme